MRRIPFLALLVAAACGGADVQVIAHRGASWDAPEHTFAAWDLALERGADWIEQDLQMTRDSVLVVLHDDSLDRTARGPTEDCTGLVREKTYAQLQRCEVGSWFNARYPERANAAFVGAIIPTLDSVLTRYAGRARFYIETKQPEAAPGMEAALLRLLRKHALAGPGGAYDRVLVQSFSPASLELLHGLDQNLPLVQLLYQEIPADSLGPVFAQVATYAVGLGPSRRLVDAAFLAAARQNGLVVHPYTVNEDSVMQALVSEGVQGMFTDRPDRLRALLTR